MSDSNRFIIKLGWVGYVVLWLLLFANITYDWLNYEWISPLSIISLLALGGGSLIMRLRGKPIITTEGMKTRAIVSLLFLLMVVAGIMSYLVFRILLS